MLPKEMSPQLDKFLKKISNRFELFGWESAAAECHQNFAHKLLSIESNRDDSVDLRVRSFAQTKVVEIASSLSDHPAVSEIRQCWGVSIEAHSETGVIERSCSGSGKPPTAADIATIKHSVVEALELYKRLPMVDVAEQHIPVVLHPLAAAVFFHEAVGHALEVDQFKRVPSLCHGEIFPNDLTIVDDASIPGLFGSRGYDDIGRGSKPIVLVEGGLVVGVLDSSTTPCNMRDDFRRPPIARMSNLVVSGRPDGVTRDAELAAHIEVHRLALGEHNSSGRIELVAEECTLHKQGRAIARLPKLVIGGSPSQLMGRIREIRGKARSLGTICERLGAEVPTSVVSPAVVLNSIA
ncbi:MAG: metallopeptidase TldD-related protein [Candidatus Thiodiazotropha endolucinida]